MEKLRIIFQLLHVDAVNSSYYCINKNSVTLELKECMKLSFDFVHERFWYWDSKVIEVKYIGWKR